jgi:hypothetical protein
MGLGLPQAEFVKGVSNMLTETGDPAQHSLSRLVFSWEPGKPHG